MKKRLFCVVCAVLMALSLCACGDKGPKGKVEELSELKGRVVYSIGQGQVPDLVLRSILKQANVPYTLSDTAQSGKVSLAYASDGVQVIGGLNSGAYNYGVLGEPAATTALSKVQGSRRMFDLQELYGELKHAEKGFPQAVLVVKKSFYEAHPAYVKAFVEAFAAGAKWSETNAADALTALKNAGSTQIAALTNDIAKNCNLGFKAATDAKQEIKTFFEDINGVIDASQGEESPIGGSVPDDAFFAAVPTTGAEESGLSANVYAPDGAPAIAFAKMIHDTFAGASFNIVAPNQIGPAVTTGNADIAIMPSNAAATVYGKKKGTGSEPLCLGVTSFGNLYLIGKE